MSSTSSQLDSILGGVESAAIEQLRCKADIVAQGQGEIRPKDWPKKPSKDKKKESLKNVMEKHKCWLLGCLVFWSYERHFSTSQSSLSLLAYSCRWAKVQPDSKFERVGENHLWYLLKLCKEAGKTQNKDTKMFSNALRSFFHACHVHSYIPPSVLFNSFVFLSSRKGEY